MADKRIHGVTEEERLYLKQLTAASLPDSPRDFGMKAGQVKPKFWKALTEGKGSVVWLINRVIDDLNAILGNAGNVYDLAVAYGFKGTEVEWLESLKGEPGVGVSGADVLNNILVLELTNGERLHSTLGGMATTSELKAALDDAKAYTDKELAEFDFVKIVEALPTVGLPNRIYLVPKADAGTQDLFDEYLWANDAWEYVDTKHVAVDLTGCVQKEEGKGLSTNDLTAELKKAYDDAYAHALSTHTVPMGGTGKKTHTVNSVLIGNGTSAVKNVAAKAGAFYSTGINILPQFGVLPIAAGGTGGNTAAAVVANLKEALVDLFYPVHSVVYRTDTRNPGDLLGGTWVPTAEGRFIVGVGGNKENTNNKWGSLPASTVTFTEAGEMGGAPHTQLTAKNLPPHNHRIYIGQTSSDTHEISNLVNSTFKNTCSWNSTYTEQTGKYKDSSGAFVNWGAEVEPVNTMSPYFAMYVWERIA